MTNNLDAAVATLTGARVIRNDQVGLGPVYGAASPSLGMKVVKSGRRSGITHGRVTAVEGVTVMPYAGMNRIIRHITTVEPNTNFEEVSSPGDSGSWWLDESTRQAVALHFAGSDAPAERALGLDMVVVLDTLQVEVVAEITQSTPAVAGGTPQALGQI